VLGCVCPHPPLLVPEIGGAGRTAVSATIAAMQRLATLLGPLDTIVVISPHTHGYGDAFTVKTAETLRGDFSDFGCPTVGRVIPCDRELADALLEEAQAEEGLVLESVDDAGLDHGILVPLTFLAPQQLVSLSVVSSYEAHKALGMLVRRCADALQRHVLFLASGDLSHRLIPSAPAGFDPRGTVFDMSVVELLERGDFAGLSTLDRGLVAAAGECGLRSLIALGAFLGEDAKTNPQVLSYEGPYGVGYLVGAFGSEAA
jgi:aromatic ring-opening dioxygenase LigB subunit